MTDGLDTRGPVTDDRWNQSAIGAGFIGENPRPLLVGEGHQRVRGPEVDPDDGVLRKRLWVRRRTSAGQRRRRAHPSIVCAPRHLPSTRAGTKTIRGWIRSASRRIGEQERRLKLFGGSCLGAPLGHRSLSVDPIRDRLDASSDPGPCGHRFFENLWTRKPGHRRFRRLDTTGC